MVHAILNFDIIWNIEAFEMWICDIAAIGYVSLQCNSPISFVKETRNAFVAAIQACSRPSVLMYNVGSYGVRFFPMKLVNNMFTILPVDSSAQHSKTFFVNFVRIWTFKSFEICFHLRYHGVIIINPNFPPNCLCSAKMSTGPTW